MRFHLEVLLMCAAMLTPATLAKTTDDIVRAASQSSRLDTPGTPPFHLRFTTIESTNRDNDNYKAQVDEYWLAPDKWRLAITGEGFSEVLVANSGKSSQQVVGYVPHWLKNFVGALMVPDSSLKGLDLNASLDNPVIGGRQFCRRYHLRAGGPPDTNTVFTYFCISDGHFDYVGAPGFNVEFKRYKKFHDRNVSRELSEDIEPGTRIEATVDQLEDLGKPDDSLFTVQDDHPAIPTAAVSEQVSVAF